MEIRRLEPSDPSEVAHLRNIEQAARSRYRAHRGLAFAAEAPAIAAERLQAGHTMVAVVDDAPVGFVLLQPVDEFLYIANISVAPDASGQGIGRALLTAAEDRARDTAFPALTLTTFQSPPWNGPWFRRRGFVSMPDGRIGRELRSILARQAKFVDARTRETLWKQIS